MFWVSQHGLTVSNPLKNTHPHYLPVIGEIAIPAAAVLLIGMPSAVSNSLRSMLEVKALRVSSGGHSRHYPYPTKNGHSSKMPCPFYSTSGITLSYMI